MTEAEQGLWLPTRGFVMRFYGLILSFLLAATPVHAADWVVARVSGQAWLSGSGGPPQAVRSGMALPEGLTLATTSGGRVRLERNAESIVVGPGTVVTARSSWWGSTTIVQQVGRIELEVEKRNLQHFTVETPFLAAVVKGTRFTVEVSKRAANVQVSHGLVAVSDRATGQVADVAPGQRAAVAAERSGVQVSGTAQTSEVQPGTARGPEAASAGSRGPGGTPGAPGHGAGQKAEGEASSGKSDHGGSGGRGHDGGSGGGSGKGQDGAGNGSQGGGNGHGGSHGPGGGSGQGGGRDGKR